MTNMSVARVLLQGTPQYAKNLVGAAFSFPKIFWHFHKKTWPCFIKPTCPDILKAQFHCLSILKIKDIY